MIVFRCPFLSIALNNSIPEQHYKTRTISLLDMIFLLPILFLTFTLNHAKRINARV